MFLFFANTSKHCSENKTSSSVRNYLKDKFVLSAVPKDPVDDIATSLSSFVLTQENAISSVEPKFLKLGQELQSLYGEASSLTQQTCETVVHLGGEGEESVLGRLGSIVTDSLTQLEHGHVNVEANLQQLDKIIDLLADFHKKCTDLEKIAQFLRVVGLNICIECSQSREAEEMFMVNAQEIKKFSENVIEITNSIRDDSENARVSLVASHKEVSASLHKLHQLADSAKDVVQEAYQKIKNIMGLSFDAMKEAENHSKEISQRVGEIVVGIQFHDNMSQRIEHINIAIQEAVSTSEVVKSSAESKNSKDEQRADIHKIVLLQANQLKEIISGIDKVYQQNSQAFNDIGNEVDKLAGSLMPLSSGESCALSSNNEKNNHPFASLQSALQQLSKILIEGEKLVVLIQGVAQHSSDTAARLLEHMNKVWAISHETHLQSLNSIVKACHLGNKGKTIAVLAVEIKSLSDQAEAFVVDVGKIHKSISSHIEGLRTTPLEEDEHTKNNTVSLEEGVAEITSAYEKFCSDSTATIQNAEVLKQGIVHTGDNLKFLPELGQQLTENLRQLEDVEEHLRPRGEQFKSNQMSESDMLSARYTMETERLVHQQLITGSEEPGQDKIDIFENDIDLFSAEDNGADFGVEPADSSSVKEAEASNDKDDLGDNVELF